jgi:surface polysaccharide O-acyltransferase-like enzyme
MTESSRHGFLNHIHTFRGIAIFSVVLTHCLVVLNSIFDWGTAKPLYVAVSVLGANGTTLFVLIAGYLFQHLADGYKFSTYFRRKLRYVILPYLFMSLPIIVIHLSGVTSLENPYGGLPAVLQVLLFYATGQHLLPMWFVPMVFLIYLLSPLLYWMDRNPRSYWLLVPLLALATLVPRTHLDPLQSLVHFLPVYVLGMFLSRYRQQVADLMRHWWPVVTGATLMLFTADFWLTYHSAPPVTYIGALNLWQKLGLSLLLLQALAYCDEWVRRVFALPAEMSFGIYFMHYYVIILLERLIPVDLSDMAKGVVLILSPFVVTAASVMLLSVGRRILGRHSRIYIGC